MGWLLSLYITAFFIYRRCCVLRQWFIRQQFLYYLTAMVPYQTLTLLLATAWTFKFQAFLDLLPFLLMTILVLGAFGVVAIEVHGVEVYLLFLLVTGLTSVHVVKTWEPQVFDTFHVWMQCATREGCKTNNCTVLH